MALIFHPDCASRVSVRSRRPNANGPGASGSGAGSSPGGAIDASSRAQILSAQKAAGSFAVEVGKQIEEIGWVLDEAGNSRFVSVMPTVWVFGRDSHHAREMAARAKRLWESEPLPWMVQEESYLNPILLTASLPFGLYPERRTIKMLERDFRMPASPAISSPPTRKALRLRSCLMSWPKLLFISSSSSRLPK